MRKIFERKTEGFVVTITGNYKYKVSKHHGELVLEIVATGNHIHSAYKKRWSASHASSHYLHKSMQESITNLKKVASDKLKQLQLEKAIAEGLPDSLIGEKIDEIENINSQE